MKKINFLKCIALVTSMLLMTACMSLGGLSRHQVKVLQEAGFVYTDDGWTLDMPANLLFGTDEAVLSQDNQQQISPLMLKLKGIKISTIIVQGHTDNVGSREYNQDLSLKRAQSVADIALSNGFLKENVKVIGYADTKPIASNDTEEGRGENRRVAVIIVP